MLTPDNYRTENGVRICEKIIPDSARASKDCASWCKFGDPMKPCRAMEPIGVTIHNTDDLIRVADDAEQYTRATWPNCNMGGAAVHYYVDDVCAWQNLRENESGWHASDGAGDGNRRTIAIECIMDGSGSDEDLGARDNAARLIASILHRYGWTLNDLYTHNHWMGKPDRIVPDGRKNCPAFLLPDYAAFKKEVQTYLTALGPSPSSPQIAGPTSDQGGKSWGALSMDPAQVLKPGDFASPYIITLGDNSTTPPAEALRKLGVAGVIIEAGSLFTTTHAKNTTFRSKKLKKHVEWCKENDFQWGLLWEARARNRAEAIEEMDCFYYLANLYSPAIGAWLRLSLTQNKIINNGILEEYYKALDKMGLGLRAGIKTTYDKLELIDWTDNLSYKFAFWVDDPIDKIEELDALLEPSHFEDDSQE